MTDTSVHTFRTALGGFHKGDVAAYIAETAAAHEAQVRELQGQIEALEQQLAEQSAAAREAEHLKKENEALLQELDTLRSAPVCEAPEAQEDIPEEAPAPDCPEDAAQAREEVSLETQELAAYRRAEAAERLAHQRAKQLYDSMQEICGRSAREIQASDATARNTLEAITSQLEALRSSVTGLESVLQSSARELEALSQAAPEEG